MTALGKRYEQEKKRYGDFRVAKVYVDLVERKIQEQGLSEKDACTQVGISTETYEMARAVIRLLCENHGACPVVSIFTK